MTTAKIRLRTALDRVLAVGIASLIVGTSLAFGGATWWAPLLVAVLTTIVVMTWLTRASLSDRWPLLKSPLAGLGVLALGLAAFQSVPMPGRVIDVLSPKAGTLHATGTLDELARADDPDVILPEPISGRFPLTVDRPATLRWLALAAACLMLFGVVSHFADRLDRLYLIWGSVVGAFLLNAVIALVQIAGQSEGLYGFIEPGKGPKWGPNVADALAAPGFSALRPVLAARPTAHAWVLPMPARPHLLGTMMGGPGALLALGALGLPLALAVGLQLMAPRGSREGLWTRLADSGQGSLLTLLYASTIAGSFLVGLISGWPLAIPFGLGILLVGLPSLFGTGLRWKGLILTTLALGALGGGVVLGDAWGQIFPATVRLPRVDLSSARAIWSDARAIVADFPIVGTGLGSFPAIQPYYKGRDAASTTAMSSLLQWWSESGAVGPGAARSRGVVGPGPAPRGGPPRGVGGSGPGVWDDRGRGLLRDGLGDPLDGRAARRRPRGERLRGDVQPMARGRDRPVRRGGMTERCPTRRISRSGAATTTWPASSRSPARRSGSGGARSARSGCPTPIWRRSNASSDVAERRGTSSRSDPPDSSRSRARSSSNSGRCPPTCH